MDLYILNDNCSGAAYGVGTYIQELIASLKNSDIKICVINLFSDISQITMEDKNDIKYWYFPKPIDEPRTTDKVKQWELYYRNIIYLLQLYIKDKKEIIFHLNYNYNSHFSKALKKTFVCKIVTSIHYLDWCLKLNGNVLSFKQKIVISEKKTESDLRKLIYEPYLKEKSFFESVDKIICLSDCTRNILEQDYQILTEKITVIYNGLTDITSYYSKSILRIKYHMPPIPILLFTGRIEYRKGLMYALKAFKEVLKVQPHCHFIIVGNGDFDLHMKECEDIWAHITWTGKLDKDKLYNMYSIADIGILPSFAEQCSYVAIEMMMHGLPLIASTSTGLNEMVEEGYNGLHIPIEERPDEAEIDTALLAEKIIYLLQNPTVRKQMGLNARKQYEKFYTSEMMGRKMLNLYYSMFEKE